MKKRTKIVIVLLLIVVVLLLILQIKHFMWRNQHKIPPETGDGQVTVYDISPSTYRDFIRSPKIEKLQCNYDAAYTCSDSKISDKFFQIDTLYADGTAASQEVEKDALKRGPYWLYSSLISFFGESSNLETFLGKNGINANVRKTVVLANWLGRGEIPAAAYLVTDEENYYITVDEDLTINYDAIMEASRREENFYQLHTETEFVTRYKNSGSIWDPEVWRKFLTRQWIIWI